jgi:hypothetical protein
MSDSKILTSLREFKDKYAWDKSLLNPATTFSPTAPVLDLVDEDYLEQFSNSERERQARAQSDFMGGW